jgi:2-hydroxy-3-oxopropionate reductase
MSNGKEKIGFVGLGMMGLPMAQNLVDAGYGVTVFDLDDSSVAKAESFGASSATSAADTASRSDIVITMVPDSPQVEAVITGPDGILEGINSGSVVIDMSTMAPETGRKMAKLLEAKDVNFVDAPVTGGVDGAEAGSLAILVGGNAEAFERALPVLNVLGGNVVHMGPVGSGHTTKIANQLIGVATVAGMSEAFALQVVSRRLGQAQIETPNR